MKRRGITDTARLDWLTEQKAETEYITQKVGPGWVREAGWRVFAKSVVKGTGDTLRQAIDAAIESQQKEQSENEK